MTAIITKTSGQVATLLVRLIFAIDRPAASIFGSSGPTSACGLDTQYALQGSR